jgi:hypothetical protein
LTIMSTCALRRDCNRARPSKQRSPHASHGGVSARRGPAERRRRCR